MRKTFSILEYLPKALRFKCILKWNIAGVKPFTNCIEPCHYLIDQDSCKCWCWFFSVQEVLQFFPILLWILVEAPWSALLDPLNHTPRAADWEGVKDSSHILPPSLKHKLLRVGPVQAEYIEGAEPLAVEWIVKIKMPRSQWGEQS